MGATAHRHPSAPHIGVLQQYYYIPQPLNIAFPQSDTNPAIVSPNQAPPTGIELHKPEATPTEDKPV